MLFVSTLLPPYLLFEYEHSIFVTQFACNFEYEQHWEVNEQYSRTFPAQNCVKFTFDADSLC